MIHINLMEAMKINNNINNNTSNSNEERRNSLVTESESLDPLFPSQSKSSSHSSSSNSVASESPSSSLDIVGGISDGQVDEISDMEVEPDPTDWKIGLSDTFLDSLQPHEKKRQDVINELFHTERSHVRNLKVLEHIFRKEIARSKVLSDHELKLIFSNLPEVLAVHSQYNTIMKNKKNGHNVVTEMGDTLLSMFEGDKLCTAAAKFCEKQQIALEFIKEKRRKDPKFDSVVSNCEKNRHCRRLQLQGFLPQEMQRLSKYPLLIERLKESEDKSGDNSSKEMDKLEKALVKSREILNKANEAAKLAVNKNRLEEMNNHLDTSGFDRDPLANEFRNFELTKYTLIYDGTVTLKRQNKNPLQVHMLLVEEAVILLQKDSERYLLKFFHSGVSQGGNNQNYLSPIIKMQNVICRENAADLHTLFILTNTCNASQMYEIQCQNPKDRKIWYKYLTDASEPFKNRDGKGRRSERVQDLEEEAVQDIQSTRPETSERATEIPSNPSTSQNNEDEDKGDKEVHDSEDVSAINNVEVYKPIKLSANDWPLIQPSEVQMDMPPVHTAEPVLTPLEQIKRKDEEVKQALAAKEGLVADLLNIPREDYQHIVDIASDESIKTTSSDREPTELVLAAVHQVEQIIVAVNESMNVTESGAVLASGGKHPSCTSNDSSSSKINQVPSVPASWLQNIATTLNSQLTNLMNVVKQREEERIKLRKELHRTREQLHEKSNVHGPSSHECTSDSTQSGDLESIEESPTETETT